VLATRFAVTLDEMLQEPSQWPVLADLIASEQLPPQRIAEISASYPEFAAWLAQDRAGAFH
jgi:hypothetical protein